MNNRKRTKVFFVLITAIIIITIPIVVGIGVSLPIFQNIENSNDWIGFWGGYLGAILGGLVTLYVLWSTVNNNEKARRRDEKIHFFEKIIELFSRFSAKCGNLCALAMRLMADPNNDSYKSFLLQHNDVAGIYTELGVLLISRKKIYDCEEFTLKLTSLAEKINEFYNEYENEIIKGGFSLVKSEKLEKDMDQILEKLTMLNDILTECVKNNLEVDE